MKSPFRTALLSAAVAGVAALALPLAASAAAYGAAPPPPPGGPGFGPPGFEGPGGMRHMRRPGEGGEHRADRLRTLLQLTPAQEPALQAFLTALRPPAGPDGGPPHGPPPADPAARKAELDKRMAEFRARRDEMEKKHAQEAALSTPQRLDLMVQRMEERTAKRDAEMKAHVAAVKTFYAALTPTQQKAFDVLREGVMHRHGDMHDGGMHEGGRMRGMGMMEPPGPPPALAMGGFGPGPGPDMPEPPPPPQF